MKIFFVVGGLSGSGGIDRVVAILSDYFVENGYAVSILLLGCRIDFKTRAKKIYYHITPGYKFLRNFREFIAIWKVKKRIRLEQPNIVYNTCWLLPLIYYQYRKKIFSAIHWDPRSQKQHVNWKLRFLTRCFRCSGTIIVPNENLKLILKKEFGFKNVIDIPNPIDFRLIGDKELPLPSDVAHLFPYILAAGRLERDKNFDLLIRAYNMGDAKEHVRLLIIGCGSLKVELQNLIDRLGLRNKVYLMGSRANLFSYMCNCIFFASSSKVETFSMVLAEALACGVPVVSTNIEGPRCFVVDNENGFLVEKDDILHFAQVIDKLYFDEQTRGRLKNKARLSVEKLSVNKIGLIYKRLFSKD
ncbi:MAG: glycosyltransferase [Gammaproteobacteria bacterium]